MKSKAGLLLALCAAIAAMALCSPDARAQTVAKTEFREAKLLYDKREFKDALAMFQVAWEHSHSPNARLYIGRCFRELGNLKVAYDELRGALADAERSIAEDPKYAETRNAAAAELALLEPQIGRLVIALDETAAGAEVTVNGEPFPKVSLGDVVAMLPGKLTVVAKAAGRQDVTREVDIAGGKTAVVTLVFPAEGPKEGKTAAPAAAPAPAPESPALTTMQIAGAVALGVGVAALGFSGAFGAAAASKHGSLEQACGEVRCTDPAFADVVDSGKTFELLSYILLGAGGGVALVGTGLLVFGDAPGQTERAALVPLPAGGLVTYRRSF